MNDNIVQPVWNGVQAAAGWVNDNIVQPVWNGVQEGVAWVGDQYNGWQAAEAAKREAEAEQQRQQEELDNTLNELAAIGVNLNVDMAGWSHEQKMEYLRVLKKICDELESETINIDAIQEKVNNAVDTAAKIQSEYDSKPWWERSGDWLKENWKGVAVGAVILIGSVVLVVATGGAAAGVLPFLANVGITALVASGVTAGGGVVADLTGHPEIAKALYQGATIAAVAGITLTAVGVGGQVIAGAIAGGQAASAAGTSVVGGAIAGGKIGIENAISNINIGGWTPGVKTIVKPNRDNEKDFYNGKKSTLENHFDRHKDEFGGKITSVEEYSREAKNFIEKPLTKTTQEFLSEGGTYFRYDTATNEFGVLNEFGGISTYFKPANGMEYWIKEVLEKYNPMK